MAVGREHHRHRAEGRKIAASHVGGHDAPEVTRLRLPEGWTLVQDGQTIVMLDTRLDPELEFEGRILELVHRVNTMRKDAQMELTDRISLTLPARDADLLRSEDWIKREVLATEVEAAGDELRIDKVPALR